MSALPCVVATLLLVSAASTACTLDLAAESITGRVMRIDLKARNAAFAAVPTLPGWRLTVDNDPSWNTRFTGHAVVGAAFASLPELFGRLRIMPGPGLTCADLQKREALALTVTSYVHDAAVVRKVPTTAIVVSDDVSTAPAVGPVPAGDDRN